MELSELEISILKGIRQFGNTIEYDELCELLNVTVMPEILMITLNGEVCLNVSQRQNRFGYSEHEIRMTVDSLVENGYLEIDDDKVCIGSKKIPIEVYRRSRNSVIVNDTIEDTIRESDELPRIYNISNYSLS